MLGEIAKLDGRTVPSEDCLYLNIFVPRQSISSADSMSVMVWIHSELLSKQEWWRILCWAR